MNLIKNLKKNYISKILLSMGCLLGSLSILFMYLNAIEFVKGNVREDQGSLFQFLFGNYTGIYEGFKMPGLIALSVFELIGICLSVALLILTLVNKKQNNVTIKVLTIILIIVFLITALISFLTGIMFKNTCINKVIESGGSQYITILRQQLVYYHMGIGPILLGSFTITSSALLIGSLISVEMDK